LNAFALILTIYVMAPVGMDVSDAVSEKIKTVNTANMKLQDAAAIYSPAADAIRGFLLKHSSARDRRFFVQTAGKVWPQERAKNLREDDLLVLVPSFTVSEMTVAFRIGLVIFLAFVLVDMLVANVLLALGMVMISPTIISVPFKLLLFVALDGWARLAQGLVLSYQ